ncbi:BMP family ABC transporter substrate-binding protein [Pseudoduganella flava]|uniref:BMP family ABC transporter substrate-binding protein n=1 Tax=Pseudoduganella flava TaxID=871742 RepID=A0ABX6G0K8_9BURK|nr:BMP family ABC transporter substrate-binding protein [Pseudoduganella flava]
MAARGAWLVLLAALLYGLNGIAHSLDTRAGGTRLRVALFVNGTLGDKSFFDAAARGVGTAAAQLPLTARIVEGGTDPSRWQAALTDLADSGDYDVVIAGTFTMVPYVESLAARFPATRFIVYDATVDYARCGCRNVYSMRFRQNEGAYLAGFLAARLMRRGLPGVPAGSGAGIVGGMQFPVIEDFIAGFTGGVRAAAPGLPLQTQYANAFSDPAAGKEIARIQYGRGAGVIFHAAGATGQGVNEAAEEARRYAIGVDMDQYALYQAQHPARAKAIVTSVLKDVDVGLVRALRLTLDGKLAYGQVESLGLKEGGVRLAPHSAVMDALPADLRAELDVQRDAIVAGRVKVPTAFGGAQ